MGPRAIAVGAATGLGSGLVLRAVLGSDHPWLLTAVKQVAEPGGRLFLRLLLLVVVPLVFASVASGVAGLGDLRRVGKLGGRTLGLTLVISTISVFLGLGAARLFRPGERLDAATRDALVERFATDAGRLTPLAPSDQGPLGMIVDLLPRNPIAAAASQPPDMLGLLLTAAILGAALLAVDEKRRQPVLDLLDGALAATTVVVGWAMTLAPVCVGMLLFALGASFGFDLLLAVGAFVGVVLGTLFVQFAGVYTPLLVWAGRNPVQFWTDAREVLITAFSTSSSNATLPTALRVAEQGLGIPRSVASFVLTVGATANQNGTALFEGVAVLFLAQVFGVELTGAQQLMVMIMAVASGIGTAGIPSGSLPFVALVLAQVGVPPEALALLIGVDRLLDMCRTTVNVAGDLVVAAVVAEPTGTPAA